MVPAVVVPVDALPLTPNGKTDRSRLPATLPAPPAPAAAIEPVDGIEAEVLAVWKRILGDRPIGTRDSFFDVGGSSFSLVLMHSALSARYPGALEVADVFASPTIEALAAHVTRRLGGADEARVEETAFPGTFFAVGPASGGDDRIAFDLGDPWHAGLHAMAATRGATPFDAALALYLLYLGKFLEARTVTVSALFEGQRGHVPVAVDFTAARGVGDMLDTVRGQRPSADRVPRPLGPQGPSSGRTHERGVRVLFASADALGGQGRHGLDIVVRVRAEASRLRVAVDYDSGRLDRREVGAFVGNYVKLMKAIVGASGAASGLSGRSDAA
jgi:hypothetical protein